MVLGTFLPEFNPEKVPLFVAILSRGRQDITNLNKKYFLIFETPMDPRAAPPGNGVPEERLSGMHIPPPGMIKNPGAHFEQKIV
jgi:hypothetical protein